MKARIMQAFIEETQAKSMKFTMDDLAKRLGISKRTLYEHFSSKTDILDAIIDSTLTEFDEKTDAIIQDRQLTLLEKIKRTITVVPSFNEFYDWKILEQMKKSYPTQWIRVDKALNQWDALRELIEEGIREGLIENHNVSLLIKLIIDATNSTLDRQFFLENRLTVSEALDEIVDVLLFGIIKKEHV
ncbi:TetR/AcrR family transcriptional regulator [Virgibacillus sp. LDC-1]|uniref:TetR/AcrR family transcriptional regulator n=1 Tax=Virgibacillus sp. LDC-1 TaxID=3039856 RepID=UPI0024DE5E97|nr:TetR/AcrR family transcriptional regulator [Virgibacillus sp. LDC-1]